MKAREGSKSDDGAINNVNIQTRVILTDFTDNKCHLWKQRLSLCTLFSKGAVSIIFRGKPDIGE